VPLLRRHLDHGPGDRILLEPGERLAKIASDHHGKAAVRMTVPREAMIGGEDDLADLEVTEALPARQNGPHLDAGSSHQGHILGRVTGVSNL
jgi:hypothetical protein